MNATISVFAICVGAIIYLLLHNLLDCTFKKKVLNKNPAQNGVADFIYLLL